jgi:hypothetical protein
MAAVDNRAMEEVTVMGVVEEAMKEAVADKEATDKNTVDEATMKGATVGAARDSSAPDQAPSLVARTKRAAAPPHWPNDPTGVFGNLSLSSPLFLQGFILTKSHFSTVPLPPARPPRWAPLLLPWAPLQPRQLSG